MMKVYSINYDLSEPKRDYSGLYDEIKKFPDWWHYLESTWLVATNESASEIFNKLRPHIDDNDSVLVIRVDKDYSGWLKEKAWKWIQKHL